MTVATLDGGTYTVSATSTLPTDVSSFWLDPADWNSSSVFTASTPLKITGGWISSGTTSTPLVTSWWPEPPLLSEAQRDMIIDAILDQIVAFRDWGKKRRAKVSKWKSWDGLSSTSAVGSGWSGVDFSVKPDGTFSASFDTS